MPRKPAKPARVSSSIRSKKKSKSRKNPTPIVIDEKDGLVFQSEDEMIEYFDKDIHFFEKIYKNHREKDDFSDDEALQYSDLLDKVLDEPDEVWRDQGTLNNKTINTYVKYFKNKDLFYVAVTYHNDQLPTFIYLHFPTRFESTVDVFRRGELVFDILKKEVELGGLEGDSLSEGDELAFGLYKAMLKLRTEKDIPEEKFSEYADFREETIHNADEIWRSSEYGEHVFVNFIREFNDALGHDELFYIVVTLEDANTNSHALLFSFPTTDTSLVDRYRQGEDLQADEVVQEANH